MEHENYQRQLELLLARLGGRRPRLLLHACCAPCSSYVLEALTPYFDITVDYYNPNIDTAEEYAHRAAEMRRFAAQAAELSAPVEVLVAPYAPEEFYAAARGMENLPEGGARCWACYRLRLAHAAQLAAAGGYDYFCTTLSISPHKNAQKLNEIGRETAARYGVAWLPSDFKKKDGFKRSTQLSAEYGMYRQDYCGCVFSKRELAARAARQAGASAAPRAGCPVQEPAPPAGARAKP